MPSNTPEAPIIDIGLGLGSNIGDKVANIEAAIAMLRARGKVEITRVSSIYKTAPWGYLEQESFANACALARTSLKPEELLVEVKAVEAEMGREKTVRWGPRLIDVDILFYGDLPLNVPDLILPHKELFNRAFVLVPLAEIAPDLTLGGRSVREAATELKDQAISTWTPDTP